MNERDVFDPDDRFWTLQMAADHVGFSRKTVAKYVREGMPLVSEAMGGIVDRSVFLAEFRRRILAQRGTQVESDPRRSRSEH